MFLKEETRKSIASVKNVLVCIENVISSDMTNEERLDMVKEFSDWEDV